MNAVAGDDDDDLYADVGGVKLPAASLDPQIAGAGAGGCGTSNLLRTLDSDQAFGGIARASPRAVTGAFVVVSSLDAVISEHVASPGSPLSPAFYESDYSFWFCRAGAGLRREDHPSGAAAAERTQVLVIL